MILSSRQYKNLKIVLPLTNKVRSVNTVLQRVEVSDEILVNTISRTFTRPNTVEYYLNHLVNEGHPKVLEQQRGESCFFEIDEVFTYENPTEITRLEIIRSANKKLPNEPDAFLASAAPSYLFEPQNLTTNACRTVFNDYVQNRFINLSNWRTEGPSNVFPSTGYVRVFPSTYGGTVNVPVGPTRPITVVQPSLFRAELKGIQPYYTSGCWKRRYTTYNGYPYPSYKTGLFEYLLDSVTINIYARTSTVTEVPYNSSNVTPQFEIAANELMQYDATKSGQPLQNYLSEVITTAMYNGKQIVTLDVLDESCDLALNGLTQIADKFGTLIRNGSYFKIISLRYNIKGSVVRTITAMEVTE